MFQIYNSYYLPRILSNPPKAYELLSNNLNFPTISYIDQKFKETLADIPQKITNIDELCDIINLWKQKFNISKSQEIKACLAFDFLYFKADFKITVDDCVSGILLNDEKDIIFPNGTFKHFTKAPSSFQTFLNLNWYKIIKSGFVFQIQTYDFKYKPFVVHIFQSPNGKSSGEIIDKLFKTKKLAKNRRILIKTFAFDGDNSYKNLHLNYFNSYATFLINSNTFFNLTTKVMHVVSDFSNLLKRLRSV